MQKRKLIYLNILTFVYIIICNLERIFSQNLLNNNFFLGISLYFLLIIVFLTLLTINIIIISKYKKITISSILLFFLLLMLILNPYALIRGTYALNSNYDAYVQSIKKIKESSNIEYNNNEIASYNVNKNLSKPGNVLIYKNNGNYLIEYYKYGFVSDGEVIVYSDFEKKEMYGKISKYCEVFHIKGKWYYATYTCYK